MKAIEARARALPELSNETRLDALCTLEADLMLKPDAMTRIAAALTDQQSAKTLANRLKLSNEERDRLVAGRAGRLVDGDRHEPLDPRLRCRVDLESRCRPTCGLADAGGPGPVGRTIGAGGRQSGGGRGGCAGRGSRSGRSGRLRGTGLLRA